MAAHCLLPSEKNKLIDAIRSGDLKLENIYHMTNDEAHSVFEKVVGKDSATLVNAEFQKGKIAAEKQAAADYITASDKAGFQKTATQAELSKKLLSDSQKRDFKVQAIDKKIAAVKDLISKNDARFKAETDTEKKTNLNLKDQKYQDQLNKLQVQREDTATPINDRLVNKINSIAGLLSDGDYKDLVTAKMGREITPAQGDYIAKQATKLRDLNQDTNNVQNKAMGISSEYYNTKMNLQAYLAKLTPDGPLAFVRRGINIARLTLITGFATPIKVFINSANHPMAMLVRHFDDGTIRGLNPDVARELSKINDKFMKEAGADSTQLRNKDDVGSVIGGHAGDNPWIKKETFGTPAEANRKGLSGAVDKALSYPEHLLHTIAIKIEHMYTFNYVWSRTFYDTLNLRSGALARMEGLKGADLKVRAEAIMRDANLIEPKTEAGQVLREHAQYVAAKITNTDSNYLTKLAVGLKNAANSLHPDVPLGDLIEPMSTIPANVIAHGVMNTLAGVPAALVDIVKGKLNARSIDIKTKLPRTMTERYQGLLEHKNGIDSAVSIFGTTAVAGLIALNLNKKDFRYDKLGNSFVRMDNYWVNTEYFARMAPAIDAFMSMKMDPKQNPIKEFLTGDHLGEGALGSLIKTPGIDAISQTTGAILGPKPLSTAVAAFSARDLSILTNLFKPGDLQRQTFRVFTGATGVETTQEYKQDNTAKSIKAGVTRRTNAQNKARGIVPGL